MTTTKPQDQKINVSDLTSRKIELICFFHKEPITKKQFIELLVDQYLKANPLPQELKLTREYSYE